MDYHLKFSFLKLLVKHHCASWYVVKDHLEENLSYLIE